MPKNVKLPDGSVVAFPDDMSDDAISSAIQKNSAKGPGFLGSLSEGSGLSGAVDAIVHPIDTILGIPAAAKAEAGRVGTQLKEAWNTPNDQPMKAIDRTLYAIPLVGGQLKQADEQYAAGNAAGGYGRALGVGASLLAPKAVREFGAPAGEVAGQALQKTAGALEKTGDVAQEAAVHRINKTIGSLQADFNNNANPGRSYLSQGLGTSTSMKSIATKATAKMDEIGPKLDNAYKAADASGTLIPAQNVLEAVAAPVKNAHGLESGAFGSGNTSMFEDYAKRIAPQLKEGINRGGFTPSEVWDLKKLISKNTNWKSTSDMETKLNTVRETQYGNLAGILNEAVPEVSPLNRAYGDLKNVAARADIRSKTGSSPLTAMKENMLLKAAGAGIGASIGGLPGAVAGAGVAGIADTVPFKTGAASTLYRGGSALKTAGKTLDDYLGRSK